MPYYFLIGKSPRSTSTQIRVLASNPTRWKKIYALSRRPPSGSWPDTVQHIPLDFLSSPEEIATVLREKKIKPDYVFFFSYVLVVDEKGALQWGDERLVERNSMTMRLFDFHDPNLARNWQIDVADTTD